MFVPQMVIIVTSEYGAMTYSEAHFYLKANLINMLWTHGSGRPDASICRFLKSCHHRYARHSKTSSVIAQKVEFIITR